MARPITEAGAITTIEEAIHVLRGSGVRAVALIWTGAIPFALGVLLFWRDMTRYSRSLEQCALESLLLVVLLGWMNVWRGMFAARIHAQLSDSVPIRGVPRLGVHLLLGNCRLLLMPIAIAGVLSIPGAVAFFRTACTVAAVDREDFFKTVAKARKLSATLSQPVLLILMLGFIGILLFANIAVTLALLPQLGRILTGYETSFTRAGFRLLADPSFYLVAGLITWLAFEPLAQAVYTVAAFHAVSKETGEDVRVRFRALVRSGGVAALLLVLCAPLLHAGPGIDPAQLDRSVHQTLASPEYRWNVQERQSLAKESWFVRFTDSLGERFSSTKKAIGRALDALTSWLRRLFETPQAGVQGPPASGAIRSELYIALALALLLAAVLVWRGRVALARRRSAVPAIPQAAISLAAENVTADQLPEDGWYALAEECFTNAQFRLGLRALYLASLAGLAHEGWIVIHPGKTDHEYETELRRRARAFPEACELFRGNVELFERIWYGDYPVSFDDCQTFRDRTLQMKSEMAVERVSA